MSFQIPDWGGGDVFSYHIDASEFSAMTSELPDSSMIKTKKKRKRKKTEDNIDTQLTAKKRKTEASNITTKQNKTDTSVTQDKPLLSTTKSPGKKTNKTNKKGVVLNDSQGRNKDSIDNTPPVNTNLKKRKRSKNKYKELNIKQNEAKGIQGNSNHLGMNGISSLGKSDSCVVVKVTPTTVLEQRGDGGKGCAETIEMRGDEGKGCAQIKNELRLRKRKKPKDRQVNQSPENSTKNEKNIIVLKENRAVGPTKKENGEANPTKSEVTVTSHETRKQPMSKMNKKKKKMSANDSISENQRTKTDQKKPPSEKNVNKETKQKSEKRKKNTESNNKKQKKLKKEKPESSDDGVEELIFESDDDVDSDPKFKSDFNLLLEELDFNNLSEPKSLKGKKNVTKNTSIMDLKSTKKGKEEAIVEEYDKMDIDKDGGRENSKYEDDDGEDVGLSYSHNSGGDEGGTKGKEKNEDTENEESSNVLSKKKKEKKINNQKNKEKITNNQKNNEKITGNQKNNEKITDNQKNKEKITNNQKNKGKITDNQKNNENITDNRKKKMKTDTNEKSNLQSPINKKFDKGKLSRLLEEAKTEKEESKPSELSQADALRKKMADRLTSARFRMVNEELYTIKSTDAVKLFKKDREAFDTYHTGYQAQVKRWPVNPLDLVVKWLCTKPKEYVVADFGCGEAALSLSVPQKKVHSLDLVAANSRVTVCDMAHSPLTMGSVDVVVFCLSLMGTNIKDFIIEANRVLREGGIMKIAEVESRFGDIPQFVNLVSKFGFHCTQKDTSEKYFFLFEFKKNRKVKKITALPDIILKPCVYKKR
ncbi:ribosomal RNA-processing protein 8-like isoform X2 [Homarus americanus]|uniref:ribosomal RNA-processing protein 8-like isoform X2 n=1 Tax=Homarus americanus TaxID=6706 RepID=UPI001C471C7D|nr:ribosomal RNA-processing protein 8-like isoform X2 [Homarus americanus]